jgi:Protein of unknown function (DUF2800)
MSAHSRFGASSAHRWMRCPGSIQATAGMPNPSSEFAEEGTMLHEVAANILLELPHEYELTDEQQDVVDVYVETVRQEAEGGKLFVEQKFKLPHHPEFWGTADAVIASETTLKVLDLKAGRGVAVEVDYGGKINPQLGFYALGAMAALNKWEWDSIEIIVVQPRLGGVKRRVVDPLELADLAQEMVAAVALAEKENPPFAAGSHCKFCLARATCPTLREEVWRLVRMDFDAVA